MKNDYKIYIAGEYHETVTMTEMELIMHVADLTIKRGVAVTYELV